MLDLIVMTAAENDRITRMDVKISATLRDSRAEPGNANPVALALPRTAHPVTFRTIVGASVLRNDQPEDNVTRAEM